ncbi:Uncharacterised protein [Neisseria animaloris]|uniref:Uncharacterized protein n=1 Tax=Neisseria animaloris TaxID=326522 RepID=A0A1X3CMJ7_9NEIS|nr:hypothetical protein [Neisseria animaloris]MDO5073547.1 hypothetical protein [Neisseria animaloris]OSI08835.1 hypothetical protein BWD08_01605 [Neisseria animaloris]VEH87196.1 Uncharacterised protein [Neisseria animaloris]VEJ20662.1 Uncharacterised protein [Neisseria animaloris]
MRTFFSIIFLVVAVTFFHMFGLVAFISTEPAIPKGIMLSGTLAVSLITLMAGLASNRFKRWQLSSGLVMLASGVGMLGIICFFIAWSGRSTPSGGMIREILESFHSYFSGSSILIIYILAATRLLTWHKQVTAIENRISALKQRIQRL